MKQIIGLGLMALLTSSILAEEYSMEYFSIEDAMQSELFKKLDQNISFEFSTDSVYDNDIIVKGAKTKQAAKIDNRSNQEACNEALFKALLRFQKRALKEGGTKVVNLTGYAYKENHDNKSTFQCVIVPNKKSVVYLKGDIAK